MNKIFVCHHSPLTHRKEYLINFFSSKNIEVEWVENFSPEEIVETYGNKVKWKSSKLLNYRINKDKKIEE